MDLMIRGQFLPEDAAFASAGEASGQTLNSSEQQPNQGAQPEHTGPVLVMPPKPGSRGGLWLQRLWLVVFVLFCLEVGISLVVLPWLRFWTENALIAGYPQVQGFLKLNFVRGLVSGLGLVDIGMGVMEAIRYHETPSP
jgi:hypothetical protein